MHRKGSSATDSDRSRGSDVFSAAPRNPAEDQCNKGVPFGEAAAQVIQSSVNELLGTERLLEVGVLEILIMGATTVIKLGLWIWCKAVHFKTGNVTVRAAGR